MTSISFLQKSRVLLGIILAVIAMMLLVASCENFNGPKPGTTPNTGGGTTGGGTTGGGTTGGMMTTQCDTNNVSYAMAVKPILDNNCTSCHAGAGATAGVDLSSVAGITRAVQRSRIFPRVLTGSGGAPQMPPGSRLSPCDIDKITAWVNQGARNN